MSNMQINRPQRVSRDEMGKFVSAHQDRIHYEYKKHANSTPRTHVTLPNEQTSASKAPTHDAKNTTTRAKQLSQNNVTRKNNYSSNQPVPHMTSQQKNVRSAPKKDSTETFYPATLRFLMQ